jgi:Resolvase, N terminal domain/Helix-turn-helix domain of resolvase
MAEFRYRGREIRQEDILYIRTLIERHPNESRRRLSARLCEAWQWRQTEALDLTTPAGRAMAALLAVFAAFEREILGERVRAGLAHARQNGKRLGRPATATLHDDRVRKLRRSGLSKSEIARRLQIGRTSVRRILDERT